MENKQDNKIRNDNAQDKINLDYDWNTEYGDGDIPDVDKNRATKDSMKNSKSSE